MKNEKTRCETRAELRRESVKEFPKGFSEEFPEVPQNVHQAVLDTLAGLDKQEAKKVKRMKKRTVIILAAMTAVLGMTAAAAGVFKWNERAGEVFEAETQVQDQLVLEQVAEPGYQTVTDNGLTITAVQTIQDATCFYALLEVTAEDESMMIDSGCSMDLQMDFQGKEDPFAAFGSGFVGSTVQGAGNSRYYELFGTKLEESEADLCMNIHFTALRGAGDKAVEGGILAEGSWDFSLNIHPAELIRFDLNREYQIAGQSVTVQVVELSPLTVKLVCDEADVKALEEKEGVNLNQLDEIRAMYVNGVKYQDGTVIEENGWQGLTEGYDGSGSYVKRARFSHVIEVEKAAALLLGDDLVEISLQ